MLFCLISLVGTASAEDISDNEIISYDDTIDISTENSNLQEISDLSSASDSNDMSNEISNADDTADDTSDDVIAGSSSKEVLGANKLYASHDLSGSTLAEIQAYLDSGSVAEGDTIYLGNQTWNSGNWGPWDVNQVVKVNIPNLVISGGTSGSPNDFATINAGSRVFQLNAPGITLTNLAFTTDGGPTNAVNVTSSGATIKNCIFDSCHGHTGGAIQATDGASNLQINNCNFTNCEAIWSTPGGAIYSDSTDITINDSNFVGSVGGVTVVSNGATKVNNCNFTDNAGASIYSASNTDIENTNFINNGAGAYNNINIGAVYSGGNTRVENSKFEKNNASNGGYGGINSHGETTVINSNFTENVGGAISSDANAEITNCIIANHESGNSAVDIYGTATVSNSNFTNNTKTGYSHGGAIYVGGDNSQITNSNFEDNHAGSSGAIYTSGENTKIENCNFTDNSATTDYGEGGAIEVIGQNTQITDSTFKGNKAPNGGAIMDSASGLTITNCDFEDNSANYGGAVNIYADDTTISGSNFTDNEASSQGGAIYIGFDCHNAQMTNCNFTDNAAPSGTAIYCDDEGDGKVTDCNFGVTPDLTVDNAYPALVLTLGQDYSNVVVGDIEGASGGSMVPVVGEPITLEVFDANGQLVDTFSGVTDANGQVVYDYGDLPRANYIYKAHYLDDKTKEGPITMAEVEGNNFSDIQAAINTAEPGGVIFLKGITYLNDIQGNMVIDKPITIIGSEGTVLDAEGLSRIFKVNDDVKNVNLNNITFINGHADEGGAIYGGYRTNDLQITNCDFINNTADIAGGAVKHHSNWTFTDSKFINNSANPNNNPDYVSDEIAFGGGAIWCCDGITNLVGTDFINNNATFGGAIRGAVNARYCVVENNTAFNGNGGGIDLTIDSVLFDDETFMTSVQIRDSNFTGNSAQGEYMPTEDAKGGKAQGGAIHIYRVEGMVLDNITCTDNSAYRGGALDLYVMNYTTITNSNISDNTATLGGGVAVVGDNCKFTNLTLTNNYAEYGEYHDGEGGALWVNGSNTLFENSTLDKNVADAYGGGIMSRGSNCSFVNNNLTSNEAFFGGGIAIESHDDSGFAENITFYNNTLLYNEAYAGGGVLVQADQVNFTDNVISNNTAATTGGAFYVVGDELYIDNLTSDYNTALNGGSCAIYSCDGLIVKNSTFTGNQALVVEPRGLGGAMHLSSVTSADIQANFYNNTAKNGSAIYSEKSTGVYIHDSDFVENQAYSYLLSIAPENNTVLNENQSFNISVTHIGGDNIMNAIYNTGGSDDIGFTNVTYPFLTVDGREIIRNTNDGYSPTEVIRPVMGVENSDNGNLLYQDDLENNQIINVLVKDKNNNTTEDINGNPLVFNGLKSDIYGTITIPVAGLKPGRYYVAAAHPEDTYYKIINNITVLRVGPTDLEINKTVSNATCDVEDIVDWNVTTGNIGPIDAENVTIKDILPEGLDLLNLTFNFVDSINGNWCTGKLNLSSNTLTYGVYNKTADAWTYSDASYDEAGTWTIVIPDIDGNDDILKPVTIKLTLNKATTTTVSLFVSDLLESSSVVMNLVTNVTQKGEFTNIANVTTDTPETNYTNNNATNTTRTDVELTNLTVNKVWDDKDNQDGVRPVNVTIELYSNGVKINETVLSAENNWTYTFTDLPVNENGQIINYTVNETPITNYTTVITNETAYNWTVTNNHTPLVTVVNVTKDWEDNNNQDGVRPPSVVVHLYADGVKIDEIILSEENGWKWTFPDLAVYKNNGTLIVYTVNETAVANYTAVITNASAYDWTVTNNHTPIVTELNVTKVWVDADNQDGVRPPSVTVELFADGVKINETVLSADNDWKFTFPDLAVYKNNGTLIVYTVNETAVANYTVVITNASAYDWTVTNNHTPIVTELNVTKVWIDADNQDGVRPVNVTVYLYANGEKINETVLTADNDWKHTFPDLAVYSNGQVINYTIREVVVANYTVVITNASAYDWTVTNNHTPIVTELNVTKVWDDNNNQDGVRPVNVTVYLYANDDLINQTVLTADNDWKHTFPDLAVYSNGQVINYTIREVVVANYTVVITNASAYDWTVTNNHTPIVTELNVTKVWDDNNNQDGVRPVNVTVYLYANGEKINETVLSADNDWKHTFPDLAVYSNGQVINYTIREVVVANYTVVITNASAYDWTVTNNHTPIVTELNVTKVWDDNNNQDGVRPVNVTVYLYANDDLINQTVLTADNDWKHTFPDLAVYSNGQVINYTIREVVVANYTVVITNATAYDWTVTNNHTPIVTELNVTKVWDDNNNQDGVRPVNVTVYLYANGEKINETVLSEDNDWKFTFPDLAVYSNGQVINYTIREVVVANYTVVITNATAYDWTVTNKHTHIDVPNMTVQKIANDVIVYVGNETSFTIVVENTGDCNLSDVNVTETWFSDGLEFNGVWTNGSREWTYNGAKVWTLIGILENGTSASFNVFFNVTKNGTLINNITAKSNLTNETNATNNTKAYLPNMTVVKVANDVLVYVGNETSFTIVVENTGDCNLSDVNVTETWFSDGLEFNGVWTNGSREWTYNGAKVWTLNGILESGATASFNVFFNVTQNGTLYNNVTAKSNLTNDTNASNQTKAYLPNLTVQKITIDEVVYVGNTTSFKVVVTNTGDCNLSDVVVTDVDYSEGLVYANRYDNSSREWTYDNGKWTLVGDLEVGQSAEFTVYFLVNATGVLVNNVTATSNLTNETNSTNNTTAYGPNMTVQKITIDEVVYVGNTTSFRIVVTNTGDCNLSDVVVTDVDFSQGLEFNGVWTNGSREWTYDGNNHWTLVGDLGVGESADFTVYFNVTLNGTLVNNVTASSNLTNETNNTNNTTAYAPNMTLQKVTLDKEVYVGNTTRFTIVVENTGDCVLDKVYVVDTDYDHSALQYLRYENGSRNWNYDDNGKWTLIGTLAVGEKANFTVWFEVLTNGTFVNNVTAGSNLTNETNNTNNTTGKPICDLAITKIVNTTHCYVDDLVEWNITVVNHGPSTALDVIVKDVLPEGLKLVDVRGGTYNNDTHEWIIGTLDKDQSVSIVLVTQVLINGTIRNNASVNTTINETNYTNNNATNVTEAEYICDLVITKAVNCTSCYVSDVVEWNITVVNVGPHNATNVIVKDILPEGMELISYRVSVGNFNEVISEWSIGTLEKDTPVSLVLVTKVLINGTFINIATVNTTTPESDYTNNEANNTTRADPICDLVIIKVVDSKKVYLGEIVSWTIKITNNGPSEALDVKVEDILPDGLVLLNYKASKGKYVDGVWTVGTLANGASETITLKTNTSGVGNITNPASVNTTTHESNYTNNNDNDTTEVLPYVDLVLIKSSDKPKYNVNDTMHWIIKVVNRGPCDAIDAYVLDVLPSSTKFVSYTSSKGSFDAAAGVWSIGDLANGEEAVLDIICKALSAGNFTNNATVNNSVYDVNTSNNYDNATIEVVQEDEPVPEPPEPTPDEPVPPVQILKTGNPLVVLLIALMAICGSALRCRKE